MSSLSLSTPRLIRLLDDWAQPGLDASRQDVAERLSHWLGALDTVKLDAALQAIEGYPGALARLPMDTRLAGLDAMKALAQSARTELLALCTPKALQALTPKGPQRTMGRLQALQARLNAMGEAQADPEADPKQEADYATHLARYQELQKQMEQRLATCRAQVRQILSRGSGRMRQLAALDTTMEQMLGAREQRLLASVPLFLERRFEQRKQASRPPGHDDEPARWLRPGGWLHAFAQDQREMLLAEVQFRMQPILGLIEATEQDEDPVDPTETRKA